MMMIPAAGGQLCELPYAAVIVAEKTSGILIYVEFGAHEIPGKNHRQKAHCHLTVQDLRRLGRVQCCVHQKPPQSEWITVPVCAVTE